jgi:hypothetical protein
LTRAAIELAFALLLSGVVCIVLSYWTFSRRVVTFGGASAAVLALAIVTWLANWPAPAIETVINEPKDGAEVGQRTVVSGKTAPTPEIVYVLVHPRSTSTWWVQELPLVQRDGKWSVDVYIGTASAGIGESFDIIAVATNDGWLMRILRDADLATAEQLSTMIPSLAKSNLVTVKRIR